MPLDLTISIGSSSEASTSTSSPTPLKPTCYISLPSEISNSLNTIEPFSPLIILTLCAEKDQKAYVAWDGLTNASKSGLQIHSNFASLLNLQDGMSVSVVIVERTIPNTLPKFPLTYCILRPLSYDEKNVKLANDEYNQLTVSSEFLQSSFLSCIRVFAINLCFPLTLPAGNTINLKVISIQTRHNANQSHSVSSSTSSSPPIPYAVVMPDSRIEIQSPPALPSSSSSFSSPTTIPRPFISKLIAVSKATISDLSEIILNTCAIVNGSDAKNLRYAIISKKSKHKQFGIPLTIQTHKSIPKGYVSLPSHVWMTLNLSPFTSLIVQPTSKPTKTVPLSDLAVIKNHNAVNNCLKSFDDITDTDIICFNGMILENGMLKVKDEPFIQKDNQSDKNMNVTDIWDDESLNKPDKSDIIHINWLNDPIFAMRNTKSKLVPSSLLSNRQILQPFILVSSNSSSKAIARNVNHIPSIDYEENENLPWNEGVFRRHLIGSLTVSLSKILYSMLSFMSKQKQCKMLIQSTSGNGKTFLCKTISSILRHHKQMRSLWIRGKVHSTNDILLKLYRLQHAFHSIMNDNCHACVVIDDFDMFCNAQKEQNDQGFDHKQKQKQKQEEQEVILEWINGLYDNIITNFKHLNICVLIVCENIDDLHEDIKVPGFIDFITNIPNASEMDRSFLLLQCLKQYKEENKSCLTNLALRLGKQSEGFSLTDVVSCITQSKIIFKNQDTVVNEDGNQSISEILKSSIKTKIPNNLISMMRNKKTEEQESKKLKWDHLGGIKNIQSEINEYINLRLKGYKKLKIPINLSNGILLYGSPGTGKTKIGLTLVNEYNLSLIHVKGSEILNKYIGESERQLRNIFKNAEQQIPCIILFDEFDSLGIQRGSDQMNNHNDRIVNTLLSCLDGVEKLKNGIFIVATSSRPHMIDNALLRPGRIDKWIHVHIPYETHQRLDILRNLIAIRFDQSFSQSDKLNDVLDSIANDTYGYTGADLEGIVNEAITNLWHNEEEQHDNEDALRRCLLDAWKNSRPSLSAAQRASYDKTMRQFAGESMNKEDVGRRVVLQ